MSILDQMESLGRGSPLHALAQQIDADLRRGQTVSYERYEEIGDQLRDDMESKLVRDGYQIIEYPGDGYAARERMKIEGKLVESSGQGHAWQTADEGNCPTDIQAEIAAEIIDGGQGECMDYVASNGLHYRWS